MGVATGTFKPKTRPSPAVKFGVFPETGLNQGTPFICKGWGTLLRALGAPHKVAVSGV